MTPLLIGLIMSTTTRPQPILAWAEPETTSKACNSDLAIACYFRNSNTILISTNVQGDFFWHVYWHEYAHYLGIKDEEKAEEFALNLIK